MIIEARIATTYLLEQIMRACRAHGIDYKVVFLSELQIDDIAPDSIPMFVRCADPLALSWTQLLADANRSYAYYIDDNFWLITGQSPLAVYYQHPFIRRSLEFAVSNAKAVIVNSAELARFISKFNSKIVVLPTFFDFALIDGIRPSATEEIRIGFAGSPSRVDDLELVSPLIGPILEKFSNAVFEFAGVLPKGISTGERVRFFPHTSNYDDFIKFQASRNWAIGLAPLLDHESNRSKTDNKYREYSACRVSGIYSNMPPYKDVVRDAETGLLVEGTQSSWLAALSKLLENPKARVALANNAFEDARARYDVSRVSIEWAHFFKQLGDSRSRDVKPLRQNGLKLMKIRRYLERVEIHLGVLYKEGGSSLVLEHLVRKIRPRWRRSHKNSP